MKINQYLKWMGIFLILFCVNISGIFSGSVSSAAEKDIKKPSLTLKSNTEEMTNKSVTVTVTAKDASGISLVKWASGSQKASYFSSKGTKITLKKSQAKVIIKNNGTYTFYVKDKAGNITTKKLVINNIDKTPPVLNVTLSNSNPTNKSIKVIVEAKDESGINAVKYLLGQKEEKDFDESAKTISLKSQKGSVTAKKNNWFTVMAWDKAGNTSITTIHVNNIDLTAPSLDPKYTVMNQTASISLNAKDSQSGLQQTMYLKGKVTDPNSSKWDNAIIIDNNKSFVTRTDGSYSMLALDKAGNKTVKVITVAMEMRAVWISYLEFQTFQKYLKTNKLELNETNFKEYFNEVFDNVADRNLNTVIVQVRPFGDALYPSKYFPWADCLSEAQGVNPGFDPLKILLDLAHSKGLKFEAWINPYRVASGNAGINKLADNNQAKKWMNSTSESKRRNVLLQGSILYYNPAKSDVQTLIVNGVKEIVENYDVDGIHFDDYFYPDLGTKYKTVFDAAEYNDYVKKCRETDRTPNSIIDWRRGNVNTLVKKVYAAIKGINSDVIFGISPQGNISNLYLNTKNYVDVKTWLSKGGYVDYICPQIYWSFDNKQNAQFDKMVDEWLDIRTSSSVNVYIGLAAYRAGIKKTSDVAKKDPGWANHDDELKRQVEYLRDTGLADGFVLFRYDNIISNQAVKEIDNLLSILD